MMIAINIVTSICFVLFTCAALYVIVSFVKKGDRKQRISFIRGFKKGKCLAVLLIAIPLMSVGYIYKGQGILMGIFSAVSHMVDLVVLKFGLDKVQGLLDANTFYKVTVYYCCVLVTINALLFAISLLSQGIWHLDKSLRFRFSKKDKVYIFGYNDNSINIYASNKKGKSVLVDELSKDDCVKLYMEKVNYISSDCKSVIKSIFAKLEKGQNKITVVINTKDDEKNLELSRIFSDIINSKEPSVKDVLFDRLSIYFFCDPKFEAICDSVVESSSGCIHYKNKYQMIATNFIERYPLANFMNENHIDYDSALVKDGVDINVCMIGFGRTNRQIFLTSVANNQFLTKSESAPDGVQLKQVKYHIFDKISAQNDKNLNHSYYRYRNGFFDGEGNVKVDEKDYLPLPQLPAIDRYVNIDVNDAEFYNHIKEAVSNKKDANFIIIAFDSDLENIDMAHKLVEKRKEWGIEENLVIFVKARKSHNYPHLFNGKDVILIGNQKEDVYNLEEITNDAIYRMAKMRNAVYDLEDSVTHDSGFVVNDDSVKANEKGAHKRWFVKRRQLERESNMYCCLSLKSKLNLIGLDYCPLVGNPDADKDALTEKEYMDIYAKGDMPDVSTYPQVDGKNIMNYTLNFPKSKRKNLAILEHFRWNSYMISKGIIPSTRDQIISEEKNGKDYSLRRHGNLTTFEGLIDFRKIVAKKNGTDELREDKIKYDYQLLDDAYWLLAKNGYKIIKKVDKKQTL